MFALKFRKSHQPSLKFGLITGLVGGFLSALLIVVYVCILNGRIDYFLLIFTELLLTGLPIGTFVGGVIGLYYRSKDFDEGNDESKESKFYQSLMEKEKKEKKKRKFS